VGDLEGNTKKIIEFIEKGKGKGVDMVVFPELAITGYPPKDLLLKPDFLFENKQRLREIVDACKGISCIVGFVDFIQSPKRRGVYDVSARLHKREKDLYNAACMIDDGRILGIQYKTHLPNYDIFDEERYFEPAKEHYLFNWKGMRVGVSICEDIWVDESPADIQARRGADFLVNISASPFYSGKSKIRRGIISEKAKRNNVPIAYLNLVGGQDDLVFDGSSCVFDSQGRLIGVAKSFEEDFLISGLISTSSITIKERPIEEVYKALILGIKDYVHKNGFEKVVIGLSGGIDSALTAVLATQALGPSNVLCLYMPSQFSSKRSFEDAKRLASNLGVDFQVIPIQEIYESYLKSLRDIFKGTEFGVTEENIQARIRGNILMAVSNKFGYLVLSTGNKSEFAVGYTTLYGDMAGGLAVLSDVPKTTVYELAHYINSIKKVIPESIIKKPPSAELRENQKDEDDLPPYRILDPILHLYIEENRSAKEIEEMGFKKELVREIIRKVDRNEYKRQQAPVGIKITPKAFGFGRRMPITNRYY